MSHVYVLTNQHQQFLSKSNEWIDGRENTRLFRSEHKDVAINQMFEANTRNVSLRIELLECELDSKRHPIVPESALSETPIGDLSETPIGDLSEAPGNPSETPPEVVVENAATQSMAATAGDPDELPQPSPSEVPPGQNPEVEPQPAPEVEPNPQPEVNPDQYPGDTPEIEPDQPPESALSTPLA